jgi:hypothetical protein
MKLVTIFLFVMSINLIPQSNWVYEPEELILRSSKIGITKIADEIYSSNDFKIRYGTKSKLSPIDYNMRLDSLKMIELRMLKYELYARKGYLFDDAVIRDYFNAFKWYQPVYWLDSLDFSLNPQEEAFYQKIKKQEDILIKKQVKSDQFDINSVCNWDQIAYSNKDFLKKLESNGFAVLPKNNIELYETYENNKYSRFPSFVTTDLYLQLMHLYFVNILITLEEENFIPLLKDMTKSLYEISTTELKTNKDHKKEAEFSRFYFAVAYELLTGERLKISKEYEKERKSDLEYIINAAGFVNSKIFNSEIDFSLFKPRGNYDRSKKLKMYFRTMMWFGKIPFLLESKDGFNRAKYIAEIFDKNPKLSSQYSTITNILNFLIGKPNNLSINDVRLSLSKDDQEIIIKLNGRNPRKIVPKGMLADSRIKIFFFSRLYTPDSHIMNEMINLTFDESRREFPRSLDVFAVFGNISAENILFNYYNEDKKWKGFPFKLDKMKSEMKEYNLTDNTYGFWLNVLNNLFVKDEKYPLVMRKDTWDKKNLNTALASYAELKHDAILYAEQPSAAECGEDEPPYEMPPYPTWVGYVEPNVKFWQTGIDFLNKISSNLKKYSVSNTNIDKNTRELLGLNDFLLEISNKELAGKILTRVEYESVNAVGRDFEDIKNALMKPIEKEKGEEEEIYSDGFISNADEMAVVADVFTTNADCLELGVGRADDLFCIVNIGGYNYLTRGSVFSFYEFTKPISERLTDDEWRKMLNDEKEPERQGWYKDILINKCGEKINELEVNPSSFIEYKEPDEDK